MMACLRKYLSVHMSWALLFLGVYIGISARSVSTAPLSSSQNGRLLIRTLLRRLENQILEERIPREADVNWLNLQWKRSVTGTSPPTQSPTPTVSRTFTTASGSATPRVSSGNFTPQSTSESPVTITFTTTTADNKDTSPTDMAVSPNWSARKTISTESSPVSEKTTIETPQITPGENTTASTSPDSTTPGLSLQTTTAGGPQVTGKFSNMTTPRDMRSVTMDTASSSELPGITGAPNSTIISRNTSSVTMDTTTAGDLPIVTGPSNSSVSLNTSSVTMNTTTPGNFTVVTEPSNSTYVSLNIPSVTMVTSRTTPRNFTIVTKPSNSTDVSLNTSSVTMDATTPRTITIVTEPSNSTDVSLNMSSVTMDTTTPGTFTVVTEPSNSTMFPPVSGRSNSTDVRQNTTLETPERTGTMSSAFSSGATTPEPTGGTTSPPIRTTRRPSGGLSRGGRIAIAVVFSLLGVGFIIAGSVLLVKYYRRKQQERYGPLREEHTGDIVMVPVR